MGTYHHYRIFHSPFRRGLMQLFFEAHSELWLKKAGIPWSAVCRINFTGNRHQDHRVYGAFWCIRNTGDFAAIETDLLDIF